MNYGPKSHLLVFWVQMGFAPAQGINLGFSLGNIMDDALNRPQLTFGCLSRRINTHIGKFILVF
ncbi:hypothetical protein SAMN05660330_04054 [Desulforhopalus singaporensis]|uniref:Uncharacterized protein n=1 Tax=Desulforhopalus singaporensis TaxID=91360 RepID=A0A1H0VGE2_9BACT|nr:hypothetical protein SAMN05660330_04054 [Desulforhopalus singaporensis]